MLALVTIIIGLVAFVCCAGFFLLMEDDEIDKAFISLFLGIILGFVTYICVCEVNEYKDLEKQVPTLQTQVKSRDGVISDLKTLNSELAGDHRDLKVQYGLAQKSLETQSVVVKDLRVENAQLALENQQVDALIQKAEENVSMCKVGLEITEELLEKANGKLDTIKAIVNPVPADLII